MLSFLFWNLNGNGPTDRSEAMRTRIRRLAKHFDVDLFVFVESAFAPTEVAALLNTANAGTYWHSISESQHVQCFHRLPRTDVVDQYTSPDGRLSIRRLFVQPREILLVALHAPSQRDLKRNEIKDAIHDYRSYITQMEDSLRIRRTIVAGDMNLNPFDDGMVSSHAFHAVMSKDRARRGERTVFGVKRRFFYNPMWSFFGDRNRIPGPPGTYHYAKSGPIVYYWNMFDQVLLRPDLMDDLHDLRILANDGEESLLTPTGLPNRRTASDHLPVFFQLRLDAKEKRQ